MEPVTVSMGALVVMYAVEADGLRVRGQDGLGGVGRLSCEVAAVAEPPAARRAPPASAAETLAVAIHPMNFSMIIPPGTVSRSVPADGGRHVVLTLAKLRAHA